MSLNSAVFSLLCVELAVVLLMIAPMPAAIRGAIVRWIASSNMLASLARPVGYSAVLVLAMWVATTREMMKYRVQYTTLRLETVDLAQKLQVEVMLFRSERNFYLAGLAAQGLR